MLPRLNVSCIQRGLAIWHRLHWCQRGAVRLVCRHVRQHLYKRLVRACLVDVESLQQPPVYNMQHTTTRQQLVRVPSPCHLLLAQTRTCTMLHKRNCRAYSEIWQSTTDLLEQQQDQDEQALQQQAVEQLSQQQQLQQVLQLNPCRFQDLIAKAPYIMGFDAHTLNVTVEALCDALYTNRRAVVSLIEQRPGILLAPYEPVQTLQQLADVLGMSSRHAAVSLAKHVQLLALSPQQLQQRLQQLSKVMHWQPGNLQAAAAAAGTAAFLQLLSADPSETEQQLTTLAQTLDADPAPVAAVAQHYPRQILQRTDAAAAMLPQLQLLSEKAGVSVRELLAELEPDQSQGLAGLLLYEASWLRQQLRSLGCLVETLLGHQTSSRVLVWLLLRLGTPNMFSSLYRLSETRALVATLKQVATSHQDWEHDLQQATDRELAVLLSADPAAVQRVLFLAATGKAGVCGLSLVDAVCWPREEFVRQYGKEEYDEWSTTTRANTA